MQRAVSMSRTAMTGVLALEIRQGTLFVSGPPIFDAFGDQTDQVSSAPRPALRFAFANGLKRAPCYGRPLAK